MANEETLDFAPNYAHMVEIDVTPKGPERTWRSALVGITECTPENEEELSEDVYYDDLDGSNVDVISNKVSLALTGHRRYGDPAQDFVQSLALSTGSDRKTSYRWTHPDGTVMSGACTLTELVPGSGMGEAKAKGEFAYRINLNSITEAKATSAIAPASVEMAEVTVAVGQKSQASAEVSPAGANPRCHFAVEDASIATVDTEGNVTGVSEGETQVTAKCAGKPSVMATAKVTVSGAARAAKA